MAGSWACSPNTSSQGRSLQLNCENVLHRNPYIASHGKHNKKADCHYTNSTMKKNTNVYGSTAPGNGRRNTCTRWHPINHDSRDVIPVLSLGVKVYMNLWILVKGEARAGFTVGGTALRATTLPLSTATSQKYLTRSPLTNVPFGELLIIIVFPFFDEICNVQCWRLIRWKNEFSKSVDRRGTVKRRPRPMVTTCPPTELQRLVSVVGCEQSTGHSTAVIIKLAKHCRRKMVQRKHLHSPME